MNRRAITQHLERLVATARWGFDHPIADRVRGALLPLALLIACVCFAITVHKRFAIQHWLFFDYAKAWLLVAYWFTGCMCAGYAVVRRLGRGIPLSEQLVLACAVGVYASYLLIFGGGILHLYRHAAFAVLMPLPLIASGVRPLVAALRRAYRLFQHVRRRLPVRPSPLRGLIWAFGAFCLGLVYLGILTPENASFDAIYYHLGIAEEWKELGGIEATPEGWIVDGLPLLASTIYAWGFIFPTNTLLHAMMTCAHMEFVLFVATLASIPLLVRWLVPRSRSAAAWVAMFLFPAILVYDAGLHSANDHIAAFWGVPIWIALRRSWERLEPRRMALFAVCAAGALLTKYQAFCLLLVPILGLFGRGAVLGLRKAGAPWKQGLAVAFAVGVVVTAPHWVKNWVWYGDPLFPALYQHVDIHPWHPHAKEALEWNTARNMQRPYGTFWQQVRQIWRGTFEFPFRTRERHDFHKDWPIFGPLFTLSLAWLPLLRGTKRLWLLFVATQCGLFFWYFFSSFERYIQPLIPWMAAVVAGCFILIWRGNWAARLAAVAMIGLELVWGGDAYFMPHLMLRDSPIRATADFLSAGFRGDLERRERIMWPYKDVGDALPEGARVLLHEHRPQLGLGAPVIIDYPGFQTGISYEDLPSARAVYDLYARLGITHIVYQRGWSAWVDTMSGDLRFWEFITNHAVNHRNFGFLSVAELPPAPPEREPGDIVAYLSCDDAYTPGLHRLADMNTRHGDGRKVRAYKAWPKNKRKLAAFVRDATFLVTSSTCVGKKWYVPPEVFGGFTKLCTRGNEDLWLRTRPAPKPPQPTP